METPPLIDDLRSDLKHFRSEGVESLTISQIESLLDALEKQDNNRFEILKLEHTGALATYGATIQAGAAALKSAILVNGGASVALLAFLGHVPDPGKLIPIGLLCFVAGTLLAAVAAGSTYVGLLGSRRHRRWFLFFNWTAIGFVVLSYVAFASGAVYAFRAFI